MKSREHQQANYRMFYHDYKPTNKRRSFMKYLILIVTILLSTNANAWTRQAQQQPDYQEEQNQLIQQQNQIMQQQYQQQQQWQYQQQQQMLQQQRQERDNQYLQQYRRY